MKAFLYLALSVLSFSQSGFARSKYGFLAASDQALQAKVQNPKFDAVIMGSVYELDDPPGAPHAVHVSYVTVIDTYKGGLVTGQKIPIVIYAEEAPSKQQEVGVLRFYFLRKSTADDFYAPAGSYTCDWTDTALYSEYGEPMRSLLRQRVH